MPAPSWAPQGAWPEPAPPASPSRTPKKFMGRAGKKKQNTVRSVPSLQSAITRAERPGTLERLFAPLDTKHATAATLCALMLVVLSLTAATVWGLPLLGDWRPEVLVAAGLGLLTGGWLAAVGWPNARALPARAGAGVAALLVTGLVAGALSDPVVIDGRIHLATSTAARSAVLSDDAYNDLRRMGELDSLLTASVEDSRANVAAYKPAVTEATEMSAKWAALTVEDLPDPAFLPVVSALKTSSYWLSGALESKAALIEQDSAKGEADLASRRATFTDNWFAGAGHLKSVSETLGIPLTATEEGPHE